MRDRFYCPDCPDSGIVVLAGEEAHHLARVLRLGPGDAIELFDGRGRTCRAEIQQVGRDRAEVLIRETLDTGEPPGHLTLATAVPKGDRLDWLVEKATELGVTRLVPLQTERSTVDPRPSKLDRLRRRIVEASKQCGRNRLMRLDPPETFLDYIASETAEVRWLAHPGRSPVGPPTRGERYAAAVGPEGGFTEAEVEAARAAGWLPVGLGRNRLRIETAGLAVCALITPWINPFRTEAERKG